MADQKIVIWPIGAEGPFTSSEPFALKQYLQSQRQAWEAINEALPSNDNLRKYLDDNIKKINSFESTLKELDSPYSEQVANARRLLAAATRNANEMWLDASSEPGGKIILHLGLNNITRFRTTETDVRIDWARRLKQWDEPSIKVAEALNPRTAALAKALLGESSTLDNTVNSAEDILRNSVDWAQSKIAELAESARESTNKDRQTAIESTRSAIDEMVDAAKQAVRAAQVESIEVISQSRIEQVRIVEQIAPKIAELNKSLAGLTVGLDVKSREIPKIELELTRMTAQVAEKIEGAEAAIKAHETAHREQLTLRSPTAYWREREAKHARRANLALGTFVAIVGASAFLMWLNFESIWTNLKDIQNSPNSGALNLTGLAIVTMPSVAFFWILKHVSRIFVENSALAADAGQRSVMMMTYLALIGDPVAKVDERERLLVLNALFRPSATSGSDDAPPSNLLDILMKASEKK